MLEFDIDSNKLKIETDYWSHALTVLAIIRGLCPFVIGRVDIRFKHWNDNALDLANWGENPDPYIERGWQIVVWPQITNSEPTIYHANLDGSEVRILHNGKPKILHLSKEMQEEYGYFATQSMYYARTELGID